MEQEPDPLTELRRQLNLHAEPEPTVAPTLTTVRPSRAAEDDRRRLLWRDSATILIGIVLALIAGQVLIPAQTAGPLGSASADPSLIAIGSFGPPRSLAPGATFGPIINPSLGVDASPTPIPVITMGPTPSPTPSVAPSSSLKPSVKPSLKPSARPTPRLSPTPKASAAPSTAPSTAPTAAPTLAPPTATFTGSIDLLTVSFTNTSTGVATGETSWLWEFGDGTFSTSRNPAAHTYVVPDTYTVTLTMTTPAGTDSVQHSFTVPPAP